jgi:uncharacterized membrane protein YbhN (UPF0104 family)
MIPLLQRAFRGLVGRRWLRIALQAAVSVGLIAALIVIARRDTVLQGLRNLHPGILLAAAGLQALGFVLNCWRWQILLRRAGIREGLGGLVATYFIGLFFSLFLPTSAGGDAVRVYQVARRRGRLAQAFMATMQERLLGLGAALLIGLIATVYYLPRLPPSLQLWAVLLQLAGTVGIGVLLYPAALVGIIAWTWSFVGRHPALQRLASRPLVARLTGASTLISQIKPLPFLQMVLVVGLALIGVVLACGMYEVIGQSLQVPAGFTVFCLVVPLVWIVRMLPISLNGVGVGEGAFVFLMGLFSVPADRALALALAIFGLQTGMALVGSVLLAWRVARGTWVGTKPPIAVVPPPEAGPKVEEYRRAA